MRDPARFQRLESRLWELRGALQVLLKSVPAGREQDFLQAARGVDYAFKSQVLTERVLAFLWAQIREEGLDGEYVVLPTKTSEQLPDIQGYLTEATFRSLHSASDLLAQVLNQTLLAAPIPADQCSLSAVRDALKPGLKYEELVTAIEKLSGSADMDYLNAFANYSKHQGFVEREHLTDFREKPILSGTAMREFVYKGRRYGSRTYKQLEQMTARLHTLFLAVVEAAADVCDDR